MRMKTAGLSLHCFKRHIFFLLLWHVWPDSVMSSFGYTSVFTDTELRPAAVLQDPLWTQLDWTPGTACVQGWASVRGQLDLLLHFKCKAQLFLFVWGLFICSGFGCVVLLSVSPQLQVISAKSKSENNNHWLVRENCDFEFFIESSLLSLQAKTLKFL